MALHLRDETNLRLAVVSLRISTGFYRMANIVEQDPLSVDYRMLRLVIIWEPRDIKRISFCLFTQNQGPCGSHRINTFNSIRFS